MLSYHTFDTRHFATLHLATIIYISLSCNICYWHTFATIPQISLPYNIFHYNAIHFATINFASQEFQQRIADRNPAHWICFDWFTSLPHRVVILGSKCSQMTYKRSFEICGVFMRFPVLCDLNYFLINFSIWTSSPAARLSGHSRFFLIKMSISAKHLRTVLSSLVASP